MAVTLPARPDRFKLEDHKIMFKNFTGRKTDYNREGDRNFCVILTDEEADELASKGWNVRVKEFDDGSRRNTLQLAVRYSIERFRPTVVMVTPKGDKFKKTHLDETTVAVLDSATIVSADVKVNPSPWANARGGSGIKAYLMEGYFVIEPDEFDEKYPDADEDEEFDETPF